MSVPRKREMWMFVALTCGLMLYWYYTSAMRPTVPKVQASLQRPASSVSALAQPRVEAPSTSPLELGGAPAPAIGMASGTGTTGNNAARAGEQQRAQAIQSAMQKMQSLMNSGEQDPEAFSQAISGVEKANGSPVLGGVNLDVLRHNLDVASQMSQLTQRMQALQAASGVASQPDGNTQTMVRQLGEQLQALGRQLNSNVMQTSQSPPPLVQPAVTGH